MTLLNFELKVSVVEEKDRLYICIPVSNKFTCLGVKVDPERMGKTEL